MEIRAVKNCFEGAGSALSHWEFLSSWRQPQEEVTSLDQSMSHDAVLLFLQSCCVWEQPLSLSKHKEWQRVVFRPAGHFCHISFAFFFFFNYKKKKKITLFHWNCVHLSPSGSAACSRMCLGVLGIQELLFGWCDAAVPGAGAVCPLDAGVMVGLATVHLLLDHQVCPQALLRSRDFTGQRGTAHNLQKHSTIRSLWHQTIRDGCHLKYHCC